MKKISLEGLGLDGIKPPVVREPKPKKLEKHKDNYYLPSDEHAATVESLTSFGVPNKDIAKYIGIAEQTLTKYYGDILNKAGVQKNLEVANTLYQKALTGDNQAMIFWLKTRAGWQEKTQIEVTTSISITQALEQAQRRLDDYIDGEAEEV
jgi:predicted transcriptional regulator